MSLFRISCTACWLQISYSFLIKENELSSRGSRGWGNVSNAAEPDVKRPNRRKPAYAVPMRGSRELRILHSRVVESCGESVPLFYGTHVREITGVAQVSAPTSGLGLLGLCTRIPRILPKKGWLSTRITRLST